MREIDKMNLEERAKMLLKEMKKHIFVENISKKGREYYSVDVLDFLKRNKYLELVGGTPKSGPRYNITNEGYIFAES